LRATRAVVYWVALLAWRVKNRGLSFVGFELTLPWIQRPAGTVAFAGEIVENYFVGHCCGCRGEFGSDISLEAANQSRS
jgi:hypothetical protein